ncbi:MAG: gas vesicle protein GvpD P-loop domain-containing protein [Thermoplasmata archaeon]
MWQDKTPDNTVIDKASSMGQFLPRHILRELLNFLNMGKHVLVVKGSSGAGKTTLVLSTLKEWGSNNIYVSTRITPDELYSQYPWVSNIVYRNNILDATRPKSIRIPFAETIEEFALPETLNVIYKMIETSTVPTTVIIDSWNAIIERLSLPKNLRGNEEWIRNKLEVLLVDSIKERGANLILTLEDEKVTKLDYLADGIVTLHRKELDGRTIREITIEKLRKMEIKQHKYLFTLHNGVFHYFEPFEERHTKSPQRWQITQDRPDHFSTGSIDFDTILNGGYARGSYNVFEIDENVSNWAFMTMIRPTILNFVAQQRGAMIVPIQGNSPEYVKKSLLPYIEEASFNNYARIISSKFEAEDKTEKIKKSIDTIFSGEGKGHAPIDISQPYIIYSGDSVKDRMALWDSVFSLLGKDTKQPILDFTSFDTLEYSIGGNATVAIKEISEAIKKIRDEGNLGIGVLKPGLTVAQQVKNMADTHFRVAEIDGAYVIYGKKPRTNIYNIEIDASKGYPETKLTLVV